MRGDVFNRFGVMPSGVSEMNGINYLLLREIKEAIDAGVLNATYCNFNSASISELECRVKAMDEIDTYVLIRTLAKYRRQFFVDILEYMNKQEGGKNETD